MKTISCNIKYLIREYICIVKDVRNLVTMYYQDVKTIIEISSRILFELEVRSRQH